MDPNTALIAQSLQDIAHDLNSMTFLLVAVLVALAVIASRTGRNRDREEEAQQEATNERSTNHAAQLAQGVGHVFELTLEDGLVQVGGVSTNRVRVLDCDDAWVLVESTNPKKPAQAVIRLSHISAVKQLVE